ncbi:hypothetical protein C1H46_033640 [Malus baccata]|uniref:Uncharacterized protein n=1 Tax=Malus baccata TaxID=106549 RepID=A0A540L2Z2_MALBA|nr:hypothetical protein C1H46_033640 [Malus baccata]
MKMYITDLQKTGSAGIAMTSSGKGGGGPKKATFFSSASKKLGKLNPFKQGSKDTSNIIDDGVDITKPRRRRILSTMNRELLKPSASVALHRLSNALVDVLPPEADSSISLLSQSEKPDVTYSVSYAQSM